MHRLVGVGGGIGLALLAIARVGDAGTLEARYEDLVLRLGVSDTSTATLGISAAQRTQALAFERRWQTATLVLIRLLRHCLSARAASAASAEAPSTHPTMIESDGPVPSVRGMLAAYRMPRPGSAGPPRSCEALAACLDSVVSYGNGGLELAIRVSAPEAPLIESLTGLQRALERTERAALRLHLRLGPPVDSIAWESQGQERSLAERWHAVDSLERALLRERGASSAELVGYVDWIERGGLRLGCAGSPASGFWAAAAEAVRSLLPPGGGADPVSPTALGMSQAYWPGPPGILGEASEEEWYDAMGRRIWSGRGYPNLNGSGNGPTQPLPRGVYFVRDPGRSRRGCRRVVVLR
ncbi:MAG: hypothetical protein IT347_11660 [Candidatus Eisenbacteria bacterium]|nr:hypothetical protein [Candidatus Eisenbacteria bacterium]